MNHHSLISWGVFCCVLSGLFALDAGPWSSSAVAQQRGGDDNDRQRGEGRGGWRRFGREGASEEQRERFLQRMRERQNARDGDGDEESQDRRRGNRGRGDRDRDDEENADRDEGNRDDEDRGRGGRRRGGRWGFDPAAFAEMRFSQLDADGNQRLEGAELEGLRGPMAEADLNGDKVVTLDELVERLSSRRSENGEEGSNQRQQGNAAGSTGSAATEQTKMQRVYLGSVSGTPPKEGETAARRTYRFTPARERLPEGLPVWFRMRDRNGDGQVSMSEYSRVWSRRMVSEFREVDLNDDGIITPKEAQAAE